MFDLAPAFLGALRHQAFIVGSFGCPEVERQHVADRSPAIDPFAARDGELSPTHPNYTPSIVQLTGKD
jgi:hypothetical protein